MVLITPLNHPLANKAAVNLAETLPYPQITFALKSRLSHQLADLFNLCGGKPNSICAVEEDETIAGLVANDFGIAVVPMMDMLYNLPIRIIPISFPKWERLIYMVTVKGRLVNSDTTKLINFIKGINILN